MEVRTIRANKNTYRQVNFPCSYKKECIYLRKLFIVQSYRLKTLKPLRFRLLQGKIIEKLRVEAALKTLKQASILKKSRDYYRISHQEVFYKNDILHLRSKTLKNMCEGVVKLSSFTGGFQGFC